ncbi:MULTISPECIES: class I SAM-dependent methyltransferase [Deefgea]|uniref:Class I SAM-dependent methyltransferase n=1 Tax=Deefgea chitinilytica TaxID=570276 RepID=A0ABS2CCP9_9NEIS|nr:MULTISPECIES: SAM-dependent methyltransferase [Deefgea]MBM5571910.1 class I SAM-dependent methyltransferase [Deefgea chitinilytica]MBM9889145.1 SAM-dependent methyltransferase [Deefgea sp. CFH1-16]
MNPQQVQLPTPSPEALISSQTLCQQIAEQIDLAGGWISFADYMRAAMYTPGLGYYSGGATKFGGAGDFVTAPEISPLFGGSVAATLAHVLAETGGAILEVGAGTGQLAAQILLELERRQTLPEHYAILELSGQLRERQRQTLHTLAPHLLAQVVWLDELPTDFIGVIVGNEVLDAMPCELVQFSEHQWQQRGVTVGSNGFAMANRPISNPKLAAACAPLPQIPLYTSEIHLEAQGFIAALAQSLQRGMILLFDYGFPASEYYHPERSMGTLIGHYRHHTIHDPFYYPGLTDLTCHVDFSAMYTAADIHGLSLEGYTSQASFLLDAGILSLAEQLDTESIDYMKTAAAIQKLTTNAEMGEIFKAIAFSKGLEGDTAPGLRGRDRSGEL